ncbi:JmjC domain-containing protein 1 [Neolecta irregularis DAH-3]|uniref:JmjC domain-containing protein 1 n=1 Tax=Neolecta irregularis (strain DAH-3) TaxID=1198029 RepID=A0A1U7LX48_NEOID|nr:JmjC domain-containing protein 1 [Neolecta irregularis DAH-3]|eukprot:OLL27153.1 JmjC domain-containing protein 1 [Neolecta irregularis DAH-3]
MTFAEFLKERTLNSTSRPYLKDFHAIRCVKSSYIPYETPDIFKADWLNDFSMAQTNDDFQACFFGEKSGTDLIVSILRG